MDLRTNLRPDKRFQISKENLAEGFGTFALVFFGTGAIVVNEMFPGSVSSAGTALVFGLVIFLMVYAFGDISGAHLNPAVTFGFWLTKKLKARKMAAYMGSQTIGATAASRVLQWVFPESRALGGTLPSVPVGHALFLEMCLTFVLMFTILKVSHEPKEKMFAAGLVIGSAVALSSLFSGPLTGASMNPARSLGPAFVSGNLQHLWIYFLGPLSGSFLGTAVFQIFKNGREDHDNLTLN